MKRICSQEDWVTRRDFTKRSRIDLHCHECGTTTRYVAIDDAELYEHDANQHTHTNPPRGTTMNDRMSDMDALVDVAARAIYDFNRNRHPWEASHPTIRDHLTAEARAALEAVGLPALLERVEAAEGEVVRLRNWTAEAMQVMSGLQEVGNALGVPLGQQITARATVDTALDLRNHRDALAAKVEHQRIQIAHFKDTELSLMADRDALAAKVADVWDLVRGFEDFYRTNTSPLASGALHAVRDFRAALTEDPTKQGEPK